MSNPINALFAPPVASAGGASSASSVKSGVVEDKSATATFVEYMKKTPEERMYESILREMGLTKEELEAMPPDEREKIEKEIQEKIKERLWARPD